MVCGSRQKSMYEIWCTHDTVQRGAHPFCVRYSRRMSCTGIFGGVRFRPKLGTKGPDWNGTQEWRLAELWRLFRLVRSLDLPQASYGDVPANLVELISHSV